MKALEILERAKTYAEHTKNYTTPREFDEAIAELEELEKKTCFTCKHKYEENAICDICIHNVGYVSYWEKKGDK